MLSGEEDGAAERCKMRIKPSGVGLEMEAFMQFFYFNLCVDRYRCDRYLGMHVYNTHGNGLKFFFTVLPP